MSIQKVLLRKLVALGYPIAEEFSILSDRDVNNLIVWLEDRILRICPISERFRDVESTEWKGYLEGYLKKIKCPFIATSQNCMIDWLLNRALQLKTDNIADDPINGAVSTKISTFASKEIGIFENIDTNCQEFKTGVSKLSALLRIPAHPDPKQTFKAICLVIESKLSEETIQKANDEYGRSKIDLITQPEVYLGFDISDPSVRAAAIALRLLHISELRQLQNEINSAIVRIQLLTADPKTDEKLGQVGF